MTRVGGTVRVPGDKSLSHRALMLAALGDGASRIRGILESADVHSTASVLRSLGVPIPVLSPDLVVQGVGLRGVRKPAGALDCGNSGTTARLMAGVVAGAGVTARFTGDESLSRRPMRRVAAPLEAMGARVDLPPHGGLPMTVHGVPLHGVEWHSDVASAQVKSAVLLAALVAGVSVSYTEPEKSRDHTERMLAARGVGIVADASSVRLAPAQALAALDQTVPGDPSSAAFFAGLAAMASHGSIEMPNIGANPTRVGFFSALVRMGAQVSLSDVRDEGGEPTATVTVQPGALRGVRIGATEIPAMIDELPLLACVASRAAGETVITGAGELRVKESDRIAVVVRNLQALGAEAEELPDGMRVVGSANPLRGAIRTHGDHRIAMAFGVLGALDGNQIAVDDPECVVVSYPRFWEDLRQAATV
ncbi:MAG TPA: 3-phosphoshikimate 1-carboxyvinyltransferase [Gemmatimonadaceae bacterium]|nr:3-phosphoshikimate 1-carboxyvinyltransferase [Gemmatimonadaceae bacterium]